MLDLSGIGLAVHPAFAPRLELEMLHRIGDIALAAVNSRFLQGPVQKLPGRTHKGLALQVLLIAGLFADKSDVGMKRSFTKNCSGASLDHGAGGYYQLVEGL